jgi:hypothetical protein
MGFSGDVWNKTNKWKVHVMKFKETITFTTYGDEDIIITHALHVDDIE